MNYNEALQSLKYKRDRKYALTGEEPYLKDQLVLASKVYNPGVDFYEFWPDGENDAVDMLQGGLFSEGVVVLNHVNEMKIERVSGAIQDSGHMVLAVFTEDANLKSRGASTFLGKCAVVECNRLKEYGNDYQAWMSSKVPGFSYDDGVLHDVYSRIGGDLFTLSNEFKKLCLFKESSKHIEGSDVEKVVSKTAVKTAYDILGSLLERNVASAIAAFESYSMLQDNYVEIMAFLFSYFEKLYRMILLRDRKHSVDAIADIIGIPRFHVASKYLPKALSLGKEFLIKQIDRLCVLDFRVRSFGGCKRVLIEDFFYGFAPQL